MNYKKAFGAGLLVFAIQMASVSVIGNAIGPLLGQSAWAGYVWQAMMVVLLISIVYFVSLWYFNSAKSTPLYGLYLGVIIVLVGFLVNMIQVIPALVFGQNILQPLLQYIISIGFWITVAITIGFTVLASILHSRSHMKKCNVKNAISSCMPEEGEGGENDNNKEEQEPDKSS